MLTLQASGSDDADEQQEPQDRGEDEADKAEHAHAEELDAALDEDPKHRRTYYEGGYEEGEDQPVGEDVHLRNELIQPGVPETNLDLAVLELIKEGVDLARVICEGIGLDDPARQASRDVGRVPVAGDEDLGRLRRRYYPRLSFSPELLYLDQEIHHLGDFDVQSRASSTDGFESPVPDLLQGMFAPQRTAQRAHGLAQLTPEVRGVVGDKAPRERQSAHHTLHVPAPHRGQGLRHPPQPLRVQAKRLRRVGEPESSCGEVENETHLCRVGEDDSLSQREPDECLRDLQVVLFFEGPGVRWRLERHASARRVIPVDVGSEEPEVLQFSKATRDLGRIEHVAAVGNVR